MNRLRLIAILVLAAAIGTLVLQNTDPVQTRFLWFAAEMPQILLLLLTAGGGFCIGLLTGLVGGTRSGE